MCGRPSSSRSRPAVAFKKNGTDWLVAMRAEDFLKIKGNCQADETKTEVKGIWIKH